MTCNTVIVPKPSAVNLAPSPSTSASAARPPDDGLDAYPFRETHRRIASARDALSKRLAGFLDQLRRRVDAERPDLQSKLERAQPTAHPTGYSLLPELIGDPPESAPPPWETHYGYKSLSEYIDREAAKLDALSARLAQPGADLAAIIDAYGPIKSNWETIDANVSYQRFWQVEARKSVEFFKLKNGVMADYRLFQSPSTPKADAEAARARVEAHLLAFSPMKGVELHTAADGEKVLTLKIATDIESDAFLAAFREGVEHTWNRSAAMEAAKLRIDITWDKRTPASLYPEGVPKKGAKVDLAKHRERFSGADFVMTTGAESTHVLVDMMGLAPTPISRRTLAHELGHFLGFQDGYLRAFEGSTDDPGGVVFVEIGPFPGSLMASPGTGRVTEGMVRALIDGYRR